MTDWCILRTRGSHTLRLADSLDPDAVTAWTPTQHQTTRDPKTGKRVPILAAVMPTFVFASAERLFELLDKARTPGARFSVFRWNDQVPLVSDADLRHLRQIEREAKAKGRAVEYANGQKVHVPDGAWQGLTGQIVEQRKGKWVLVAFPGYNVPVKFAPWNLDAAA
jgi:transcription antitermination factor NusG